MTPRQQLKINTAIQANTKKFHAVSKIKKKKIWKIHKKISLPKKHEKKTIGYEKMKNFLFSPFSFKDVTHKNTTK